MNRNRIRKFVFVPIAAVAIMSAPAWAARFVDTSGYWAEKYVNKLSDKGVILSASDGKFKPNDPITRAELAQWMVKVLGIDKQPVSSTPSFPDVKPSDPYYRAVEIIRQNNYIAGYADGYRPRQFMQRGEMISIVARALNVQRPDEETISQELARYSDNAKIPQWARQGIALASKEGILVMQTPDKVNATGLATRGETAAILSALNDYLNEKNVSERLQRADMGESDQPPDSAGQAGRPLSPDDPQYRGRVQKQDANGTLAYSPPPAVPGAAAYGGAPPGAYVQPGYPPQQPPPGYYPPGAMYGGNAQMGGYPGGPPLQGRVSTVAAGTAMSGNLKNSLDSETTQPGEPVELTLSQGIMGGDGTEVLPPGTTLIGSVTNVISAKRFKFGANGKMDIKFTQCALPDGRRIPISASVDTDQIRLTGGTTGGRVGKGVLTTAVGAGGGAALGTGLGAIVGATAHGPVGRSTGMGAVFGTALGGGVGLIAAGVRKGSEVKIPAGTNMPIRVDQTFQVPGPMMSAMPPYGAPPYGTPYGAPQYGAPPYGAPPYGAPVQYAPPPYGAPGAPVQYAPGQYSAPPAGAAPQYQPPANTQPSGSQAQPEQDSPPPFSMGR